MPGRDRVQGVRGGGLVLAARHVVERGGVDDDGGPEALDRRRDGVRVAELEVVVGEPRDVRIAERLDDIAAQLSGGTDDGDAAQNTLPILPSVCSMSWSSVIHSML